MEYIVYWIKIYIAIDININDKYLDIFILYLYNLYLICIKSNPKSQIQMTYRRWPTSKLIIHNNKSPKEYQLTTRNSNNSINNLICITNK